MLKKLQHSFYKSSTFLSHKFPFFNFTKYATQFIQVTLMLMLQHFIFFPVITFLKTSHLFSFSNSVLYFADYVQIKKMLCCLNISIKIFFVQGEDEYFVTKVFYPIKFLIFKNYYVLLPGIVEIQRKL